MINSNEIPKRKFERNPNEISQMCGKSPKVLEICVEQLEMMKKKWSISNHPLIATSFYHHFLDHDKNPKRISLGV